MSDLQCPATLLIARHGEAQYPTEGVLSGHGGRLTETGRRQAVDLAARLRHRRVAAVYTSTMTPAVQTGELVAAELEVRARAVDGLHEFSVGDLAGLAHLDPRPRRVLQAWADGKPAAGRPGRESRLDVVARFEAAVNAIADLHRGETAVAISHGGVICLALPRLAGNAPGDRTRRQFLPNCVPAEVRVDGDGWWLDSWPGTADRWVV